MLTIGIPSFVLALAPSEGPLYRGRLLRALAAFAFPAGIAMGIASLLSFFLVDSVFGGTLEEGRTAATTTLIVLGLCFIVLLERGPGREHITVQSYMLALVAGLGALFAGIIAIEPGARVLRPRPCSPAVSGSSPCCASRSGSGIAGAAWQLPYVQRLELAEGERARPRRRTRTDPHPDARASSTRSRCRRPIRRRLRAKPRPTIAPTDR